MGLNNYGEYDAEAERARMAALVASLNENEEEEEDGEEIAQNPLLHN